MPVFAIFFAKSTFKVMEMAYYEGDENQDIRDELKDDNDVYVLYMLICAILVFFTGTF